MSLPRRSPRSPGLRRTPARRRQGELAAAQSILVAHQQAISSLQARLAALITNRPPVPAPHRVPASAAPHRCDVEMSPADFRSWRRSMDTWLQLNGWSPEIAVLHIRLLCVPALQLALDSRFSAAQWSTLPQDDALDAISVIVLRSSNQAVCWEEFFDVVQAPGESISAYFLRCAQKCTECEFKCPSCEVGLSEYVLLRKLVVGLSDVTLKREVFQKCGVLNSVDILRSFCATFESAQRDAGKAVQAVGGKNPHTATAVQEEEDGATTAAAANRTTNPRRAATSKANARTCGNCDTLHAPDRSLCPARSLTCFVCGKPGHIQRCCRSGKGRPKGSEAAALNTPGVSGAVIAASEKQTSQPLIKIDVSASPHTTSNPILAVADTGAQVCVAGPSLLRTLGLQPALLQRWAGLHDVAGLPLKALGSAPCRLHLAGHSSMQEVVFVDTVTQLYLSLEACKALQLVPASFPFHTPATVASVETLPAAGPPTRPTCMPFTPLEENAVRLEDWLLRHFSSSTFNTSSSPLPVMAGAPHHIHLLPGSKPHACHTPATVPKHWEMEVKRQLDEDVARGILQPVPAGQATEWCARMVVVAKKSGQPRRTVDYQKLNECCLRETHHTQTPFDMVSGVPLRSYKTVADAYWGFHQVALDKESCRLTTFITPWGRYQYRRTPMGHCSASDAYTRRFDDAVADVPRKYKCIDDTLLYDRSIEDAFWHVYDFLETCAERGVTLQPSKFKFCKKEVEFVGFRLGWDDYAPTEDRLTAIRDFSMPTHPSITDIRSWHGFVNQLAPFLATSPLMEPFRELLKKPTTTGKKVYWDEQLQKQLQMTKDVVCQLAKEGLVYYDQSRPTAAITDWSHEGIGFVILQQYCTCASVDTPFCCKGGWRLALCGSRHLTAAEAGYAAVEGEALAVAWCLRKARLFLLGCPNLVIITDHRPLVKLLGDRALTDIVNPRLFNLKEKTLQYKFTIKYLPGKSNCAADFLSRYPSLKATPDSMDARHSDDLEIAVVVATLTALDDTAGVTMDEDTVHTAAGDDPVYQLLLARVSANDWPSQKNQEMACLRPYYNVRDRLTVSQGLVTYTYDQGPVRLVIPQELRHRVATGLHASHQGLDSMSRRARHSVYWPGMEGDLQYHRSSCDTCNTHAPSQSPEPLTMTPSPDYPFQQTVVDMFMLEGQTYMAYADRLTGWLEIAHFPHNATATKITSQLRKFFTRWGAPEQLSTDGGTNLVNEDTSAFFKKWGVEVRLSSAHYPQSNGRAESAVKSAKRLLRDNTGTGGTMDTDRTSKALLQYLNTPLRGIDKSPAQLATGRQLRDSVPSARQNFKVNIHWRRTLRDRELQLARSQDDMVEKAGVARQLGPGPGHQGMGQIRGGGGAPSSQTVPGKVRR